MNRVLKLSLTAVLAASVSGCTIQQARLAHTEIHARCWAHFDLCLFAGVVLAGAIIGLAHGSGAVYHHYVLSDKKLKTRIRYVKTLENGLKIYTFRFKGDERDFIGVLAQDVEKMPEFQHAVKRGKDGYLKVNYAKLGLKLFEPELMAAAGSEAAKQAAN